MSDVYIIIICHCFSEVLQAKKFQNGRRYQLDAWQVQPVVLKSHWLKAIQPPFFHSLSGQTMTTQNKYPRVNLDSNLAPFLDFFWVTQLIDRGRSSKVDIHGING